VQERLWPELQAVATAHERWQFAGLTQSAEALHKLTVGEGDVLVQAPQSPSRALAPYPTERQSDRLRAFYLPTPNSYVLLPPIRPSASTLR